MWSKTRKWLIPLLVVLLLLGAGAYVLFALYLPYRDAENTMDPNSAITIHTLEDGSLQVQWPAGSNADSHTLQVLRTTADGEQLLHTYTTQEACSCILPELPTDEELLLRIISSHTYRDKERPGEQCLEARLTLNAPAVEQLEWVVDPDTDQLSISFSMADNETCQLYRQTDADPQPLQQLDTGSLTLTYGQELQIPQHGAVDTYTLQLTRQTGNVTFYGPVSGSFQVCRQDFLGTALELECTELPSNAYSLAWNETKGEEYQLHMSADDGATWELLTTVPKDGERSYTTAHLAAFSGYQFRVSAVNSAEAVEPAQCAVSTQQRALYSTVWPIIDLEVYADTGRTQSLGTAQAGTAFCVIEEADGLFGIRYEDTTGYIDSNYCMINLPEYIGTLCAYDITNSYSSIYLVHDFAIDQVTDTVITGYEHVRLSETAYLVPLLYPTAQKLIPAAQEALAQGYRIKIYDTFRPREATLSIYDLTEKIIKNLVPKDTVTGEPAKDMDALSYTPPAASEPTDETAPAQESLMDGLTYEILMTDNGRYSLANFLAKGISNHNLGVALDMTLQTLDGQELEMQTAIHDLSWFSEPTRNNDAANLLKRIMTGAGFGMIKAEWWHFQDDEIKQQLDIRNLYEGVSPQCWMKDDLGWRYRQANGQYLTGCTESIGGTTYTFDADGYVQ